MKMETVRQKIMRLAAMPGGLCLSEIQQGRNFSTDCGELMKMGLLFHAGGNTARSRWFSDAAAAAEYQLTIPLSRRKLLAERKKLTASNNSFNTTPRRGNFQIPKNAVVIIPDHVRIQKCPSPENFGSLARIQGITWGRNA